MKMPEKELTAKIEQIVLGEPKEQVSLNRTVVEEVLAGNFEANK